MLAMNPSRTAAPTRVLVKALATDCEVHRPVGPEPTLDPDRAGVQEQEPGHFLVGEIFLQRLASGGPGREGGDRSAGGQRTDRRSPGNRAGWEDFIPMGKSEFSLGLVPSEGGAAERCRGRRRLGDYRHRAAAHGYAGKYPKQERSGGN